MIVVIGIPVYNVEKYIERCARSLFSQTYKQIRFYFVDDCANDRSIELLESVIKEYPDRINDIKILHHTKNRGLAAARNTVIDNAEGEFIMWVDSDDWLEPNAIENAVAKQKEDDADIVNLGFIMHTKTYENVYLPSKYDSSLLFLFDVMCLRTPHFIWSRLIRLSIYKSNDIRCIEGVNMAEDWQVLPIIIYYAPKISSLQLALCHYNCMNQSSYSKTRSEELNKQYWLSFENNKRFFSDKGKVFNRACDIMELTVTIDRLINYGKYGHSFYYDEAAKHFLTDKSLWKEFDLGMRMILYLYPNKILITMYVKTMSTLHHFLLIIKTKIIKK